MDKETKIFLGKILGEIYRIQNHINPSVFSVSKATIYGLLNGLEEEIDRHFDGGLISNEKINHTVNILSKYFDDPEKEASFKGFYDIETALKEGGVSRGEACVILRWLKANERFTNIIQKMDSPHSPTECRNFNLEDYDG